MASSRSPPSTTIHLFNTPKATSLWFLEKWYKLSKQDLIVYTHLIGIIGLDVVKEIP